MNGVLGGICAGLAAALGVIGMFVGAGLAVRWVSEHLDDGAAFIFAIGIIFAVVVGALAFMSYMETRS